MELCQIYIIMMPCSGSGKSFGKCEQMVVKVVPMMFKLTFSSKIKSIKQASWEAE